MRGEDLLLGHFQDIGHQDEQLLKNVGTNELHHILGLLEVRSHDLWMWAVFRVVYENIVVIELLGEPSLVAQRSSWFVANVKTTSIFFRGDLASVSMSRGQNL